MCSRALLHTYKDDIVANIIQHNSYAVKVNNEIGCCLHQENIGREHQSIDQ